MPRVWHLLVLIAAAGLAGCAPSSDRVLAVIPKGANHIFWQTVRAGAIEAAQEEDYQVVWNAPSLEVDSSRQIEIVDAMINRRVAGIALAPVDRKALVAVVERAHAAGIPVAIFDSGIDTEKRISYVATNNEEGGRMAARRLGTIIGGKGKAGVIGFMIGSASTMERENGFIDEMKKLHPRVEVLPVQFGMADRSKAMAVTENLLTAHPDLTGLFADNESSTTGAVQALKARNARHVKLVAFDASEQIVSDMREGWIDSLVAQNPFRMGYEAVKALTTELSGGTPAPLIDSGATLVTPENLDTSEIRELLFPDLGAILDKH